MEKDPKYNFIDRLDLPEGFEKEESLEPRPSKPTSRYEFKDSEYTNVEPPTKEEFKASNGPRDERDMNEDFHKFARAALDSEKVKNRRAFDLEMRLHTDDLTKKKTFSVYGPPIVKDMLDFLCEEMGEKQSKILMAALTLFFRNCLANEKRMLHDMGFLLDNLALQNQELCMETASLAELAQAAIELESSPFFSPDEDEDNWAEEKVPDVDFSGGTIGNTYKTVPDKSHKKTK